MHLAGTHHDGQGTEDSYPDNKVARFYQGYRSERLKDPVLIIALYGDAEVGFHHYHVSTLASRHQVYHSTGRARHSKEVLLRPEKNDEDKFNVGQIIYPCFHGIAGEMAVSVKALTLHGPTFMPIQEDKLPCSKPLPGMAPGFPESLTAHQGPTASSNWYAFPRGFFSATRVGDYPGRQSVPSGDLRFVWGAVTSSKRRRSQPWSFPFRIIVSVMILCFIRGADAHPLTGQQPADLNQYGIQMVAVFVSWIAKWVFSLAISALVLYVVHKMAENDPERTHNIVPPCAVIASIVLGDERTAPEIRYPTIVVTGILLYWNWTMLFTPAHKDGTAPEYLSWRTAAFVTALGINFIAYRIMSSGQEEDHGRFSQMLMTSIWLSIRLLSAARNLLGLIRRLFFFWLFLSGTQADVLPAHRFIE